jgi:hypothetical protein
MKRQARTVSVVALVLVAASGCGSQLQESLSVASTSNAGDKGRGPSEQPQVESFAVPGSSIDRVRATITVEAPLPRVRDVLFDWARYPEFMPRYEKASVVHVTASGGRLVQIELGGVVHLWMRVEISPPTIEGTVEKYEGRLEKGNVKAFRPRWELEPLGEGRTRLTVESYLDPDLFLVPSSLINSGTRDGMRDGVTALKARIESRGAGSR